MGIHHPKLDAIPIFVFEKLFHIATQFIGIGPSRGRILWQLEKPP
jgi:hypothetical protein